MAGSYYYRKGERIPVRIIASARVLRETGDRAAGRRAGWRTYALQDDLVLAVLPEAVEERGTAGDLQSVTQGIVAWEQRAAEERTTARPAPEAPDVVSFPVALDASGKGLLFSSGDVVAEAPAGAGREWVEELASKVGWRVARALSFVPAGYVLRPDAGADPIAFANSLVEEHGFASAQPIFLEEIDERFLAATADPAPRAADTTAEPSTPATATLFARQWHLRNTGQSAGSAGVDVAALDAWRVTRGEPGIVVAVIDSGVEIAHEVFRGEGKLTAGYNFAAGSPDPRPQGSSHGTACAALVAAAWDGGQVVGVAPGCRIMPIRRSPLGDHLKLADAIVWAVDHGADVLTCSFGVDGRPWVLPDVVRRALEYAIAHGRGGLGCPIFWAAGNGSEPVTSDEWASSETVIAVAASTDQGLHASYSDFGPEIDVCAPSSGGASAIFTAANEGYTTQFGGTSAAAPIAAGIAALLLSVAPHLRWHEVRDLLARSARKIDPAGGGYDARGHSPRYGFGQVDAGAALLLVDVVEEIGRALGLGPLGPGVVALTGALRRTEAGKAVLAALRARRFGLLAALRDAPSLQDRVRRLLPFLADLGERLRAGQAVSITAEVWKDLEQLAAAIRVIPPLAARERTQPPHDPMEVVMNAEAQTFESAVQRLAGLLIPETGERDVSPLPPAASDQARQRLEEKARVARQELYLRGMPVHTRELVQEMELDLPSIVRQLKEMRRRPTLRRQVLDQASRGMAHLRQANPGTQAEERLQALGEMIGRDLGGEDERLVFEIGVAIAVFYLGYDVVKNWKA